MDRREVDHYPAYTFGWIAQNEAMSVYASEPWRQHKMGVDVVTPPTQTSRGFLPNAPIVQHNGMDNVVFNPITQLIEPVLAMTKENSPKPSELQKSFVGTSRPGDWQPAPPRRDVGEPRRSNAIQITHKDWIHDDSSRNIAYGLNPRDQHHIGENSVIVGRIRRYDEKRRSYGAWEDIKVSIDSNTGRGSQDIHLRRGGKLGVHKRLISQATQQSLSKAMHRCKLYRQYSISKVFHEPRFHVLLSSRAKLDTNVGYYYHGVQVCRLGVQLHA
mmetsp:Transcript_25591/g.57700  ORF Transcript_25591/g.57700 Transcript_25591/m.57700 type:complete len:272 (-) Transcript_25591:34-849(-)